MPTVSIQFSNFDISVRKLSVNGQSNIITLGEGAYIVGANVAFGDATVDHILVGKYSSLALMIISEYLPILLKIQETGQLTVHKGGAIVDK